MVRYRHLGRVKAKAAHPQLGAKHRMNLEILHQKVVEDKLILDELLKLPWPDGEGAYLDLPSKKLRFEVLCIAVENGRPLAVLDEFRHLLERDGAYGRLTDSDHLANLLPLIGVVMDRRLQKKRFISLGVVFDGLSEKGSWVSVLGRGVLAGEESLVDQFLLDMPHTSAPYNHAVLNRILLKAISKIQECTDDAKKLEDKNVDLIRFLIHDDAEVNNKSCDFLRSGIFVDALTFSCLCHVKYRVGGSTTCDLVESFDGLFVAVFKNADKRRHLFRQMTGLSFPSRNKIKVNSISSKLCVI